MTEPQELRSIDELFRNTFNNLPETPAENGWDVPSDKVWQHVRNNIQAPRFGWNWQSLLIFSGFAVVVVLGLYLAFSSSRPDAPGSAVSSAPVVAAPVMPAPTTIAESTTPHVVAVPQKMVAHPTSNRSAAGHIQAAPQPVQAEFVKAPEKPETPAVVKPPVQQQNTTTDAEVAQPRTTMAAPLPGTHQTKSPNTTEELKAEHQKQLEMLWKTPLEMLPVPRRK